ncbi:MAG TPA: heme-binding protein [Polyangiaceae bacterium]
MAGLGVGAWLALVPDRSIRVIASATIGVSLAAGLARWQLGRWFSEQPRYEVESHSGDFEVRYYAPRVQAETVVNAAPWTTSLQQGFGRLGAYIFGKNAERRTIAMTVPVTATVGATDRATRSVTFKMPEDCPIEELPRPDDRSITLRAIPARRVAALRFSGNCGLALPDAKRRQLLDRARAAGLIPIGDVVFAGYDAPSTLPWLRRNEVLVEVSTLPRTPSRTT